MQEDTKISPVNPLPPVVAALFIIMIGIDCLILCINMSNLVMISVFNSILLIIHYK